MPHFKLYTYGGTHEHFSIEVLMYDFVIVINMRIEFTESVLTVLTNCLTIFRFFTLIGKGLGLDA